jgi:hypothetical protein
MRPELERAQRIIREAAVDGTREAAEDLLSRAIPLAPILEGLLRGSGHIEEVGGDPRLVEFLVVFNRVYAAVQHERTDYEHPRGGQAKYLETPLVQMSGRYAAVIAERIRRATSG